VFRLVVLGAVGAVVVTIAARSHTPVARTAPAATEPAATVERAGAGEGPATRIARDPGAERAAVDRFLQAGSPIYCGGSAKPMVALTFDDGPGPYTRRTLAVLRSHGARATFFLVAKEIDGWPALKDVPKEEARDHAIGDHTYDHIGVTDLSPADLDHQLGDSLSVIEGAAGVPVRLFRPPYGRHDAASDAAARSDGMLEVLWSLDTEDSMGATADQIVRTIRDDVRPGSIVLLHENRGTTRSALPRILSVLQSKGLQPVTVPELLAHDPPTASQLASGSCG